MKRIASLFLVLAIAVASQPLPTFGVELLAQGQGTGSIAGNAVGVASEPLVGNTVRLRNLDLPTAEPVTTVSGPNGAFSFTGLNPGNYVIEILAADGVTIIGTSVPITLAAGATLAGVAVSASAALAGAGAAAVGVASGIAAAAAAAPSAAALIYLTSTAGILLLAGGAIGLTAGIIAATDDASPSQ